MRRATSSDRLRPDDREAEQVQHDESARRQARQRWEGDQATRVPVAAPCSMRYAAVVGAAAWKT